MLLLLDIGNTCTKAGLFNGENIASFISVENGSAADEINAFLEDHKASDCFVVSVNSKMTDKWVEHLENKGYNIILFEKSMAKGFKTLYKDPSALGDDRAVTAYGAYKLYGGGLIVIDLGTAAKFCLVDISGVHLGGAILAGKEAYRNALSGKADSLFATPMINSPDIVGVTTKENIESGQYYGFVGSVDYMIRKLREDSRFKDYKTVLTGGDIDLFAGNKNIDIYDRELTLKGLYLIYLNTFFRKS